MSSPNENKSPEFFPIQEGKVDGAPALIDFETRQFAVLPAEYVLTRVGTAIMGARRKSTLAPVALKWRPIPHAARVETPVPPET